MKRSINGRVEFANSLRGVAALSVVVVHYCVMFFRDQSAASVFLGVQPISVDPSMFAWAWAKELYFDFGHFGVALFFLISGFVLPFTLEKTTYCKFAINRFFRVFPLYWVGFSVSLFALWLVGDVSRYSDLEIATSYFPGFRDMFMWAARIDGVSWTLEVEIKFYLICLAAIPLFRSRSPLIFAIPLGLVAAGLVLHFNLASIPPFGLFWWLRAQVVIATVPYLAFMFLGTVFYQRFVGALSALSALLIGAAIVGALFVLINSGAVPAAAAGVWSYGIALGVFAVVGAYPVLMPKNAVTDFFAAISYPLYVVHGISGMLLIRAFIIAGAPQLLAVLAAFAIVVALAWVLHILIEIPSMRLGKMVGQPKLPAAVTA